jgi:hypothetical protein
VDRLHRPRAQEDFRKTTEPEAPITPRETDGGGRGEEATVAQWSPQERDAARQRVGTATAGLAILAAGAAGAASILAWHATTDAAAASTQPAGRSQVGSGEDQGQGDQVQGDQVQGDQVQGDDQGGGDWSGVSGGGGLPGGGIQGAAPPGQGSGGGSVRSQGS